MIRGRFIGGSCERIYNVGKTDCPERNGGTLLAIRMTSVAIRVVGFRGWLVAAPVTIGTIVEFSNVLMTPFVDSFE